jgi:hypothetical protein
MLNLKPSSQKSYNLKRVAVLMRYSNRMITLSCAVIRNRRDDAALELVAYSSTFINAALE